MRCRAHEDAIRPLHDERFDLIMLDVMLPRIDGVTLCRHVREVDATVPVLMCSALSDDKVIEEARAAGATHFLFKPFQLKTMAALLRRCLSESKQARAGGA